jgi:Rap1a immunity proteins
MNPIRSVLAAVLTSVWIGTPAQAQTARELLHVCESLQRGMRVKGTQVFIPPGSDVAQCWGFMLAVQQYSTLADHDGKTLLGACPKPDTTTTQVLRTFIEYARSHPDELGLPAADIAFNAMAEAFPCGEEKKKQ